MKSITGHKREKVRGQQRKLHNIMRAFEICAVHPIFQMTKSRLRFVSHVVHMEIPQNTQNIFNIQHPETDDMGYVYTNEKY
jgi:hypothetical protein